MIVPTIPIVPSPQKRLRQHGRGCFPFTSGKKRNPLLHTAAEPIEALHGCSSPGITTFSGLGSRFLRVFSSVWGSDFGISHYQGPVDRPTSQTITCDLLLLIMGFGQHPRRYSLAPLLDPKSVFVNQVAPNTTHGTGIFHIYP